MNRLGIIFTLVFACFNLQAQTYLPFYLPPTSSVNYPVSVLDYQWHGNLNNSNSVSNPGTFNVATLSYTNGPSGITNTLVVNGLGGVQVATLHDIDFTATNPFTISTWVILTNNTASQVFYSTLDNVNYLGYELSFFSGQADFMIIAGYGPGPGINVKTASSLYPTNTLLHICVTYDGSGSAAGVTFYLNSVVQAKASPSVDNLGTATFPNAVPTIANRPDLNNSVLGLQLELQIFNSNLPSIYVSKIYSTLPR